MLSLIFGNLGKRIRIGSAYMILRGEIWKPIKPNIFQVKYSEKTVLVEMKMLDKGFVIKIA